MFIDVNLWMTFDDRAAHSTLTISREKSEILEIPIADEYIDSGWMGLILIPFIILIPVKMDYLFLNEL